MLEELLDDINGFAEEPDMEETRDWLRKIVNYNVPHGKQIRQVKKTQFVILTPMNN